LVFLAIGRRGKLASASRRVNECPVGKRQATENRSKRATADLLFVSRLETLSSVCFLWITVISNCFGGPVRKLLRVRRSTSILTAILREVNGAEIRRQDALRDAGQAGATEENSSSASQYPVILTRLEMGRDVCFVGLMANSNRFGVAIRMDLVERRAGRKLLANVDLRGWAKKRRQDALRGSGQAGATSDCRVLAAAEMNFCARRRCFESLNRCFGRGGAVRSRSE
jgi:hypothetical protein